MGSPVRTIAYGTATAPDAEQDRNSSCVPYLLWDDDGYRHALSLDGKIMTVFYEASMNSHGVLPHRGHFLQSHVPIAAMTRYVVLDTLARRPRRGHVITRKRLQEAFGGHTSVGL
jgi:hypothetical protein